MFEPSAGILFAAKKELLGEKMYEQRLYFCEINRKGDLDLFALVVDIAEAILFKAFEDIEDVCASALVHVKPIHAECIGEQKERKNEKQKEVERVHHMGRSEGVEFHTLRDKGAV